MEKTNVTERHAKDHRYGKAFEPGDKVEVYTFNGKVFKSMVEDIAPSGDLLIGSLYNASEGGYIRLAEGEEVTLKCYRDNGVHIVRARVVGYMGARLIQIEAAERARREQRRAWVRVATSRVVTLTRAVIDPATREENIITEDVTTYNISATGVSVRSNKSYETGAKLLADLHLEETSIPIRLNCEVRSCMLIDEERKIYRVGLMFLSSDGEPINERNGGRTFERLSSYVLRLDLNLVKQKAGYIRRPPV